MSLANSAGFKGSCPLILEEMQMGSHFLTTTRVAYGIIKSMVWHISKLHD